MKEIVDYIEDRQLNESAALAAAIIASQQAFSGYNGGSSDEPGLIRALIDSIKDKREQKIVANALAKLKNDKDIEDLVVKLDKEWVDDQLEMWKRTDRDGKHAEKYEKWLASRSFYDIVGFFDDDPKCERLLDLVKSKLNRRELKYIKEIMEKIRVEKNQRYHKYDD